MTEQLVQTARTAQQQTRLRCSWWSLPAWSFMTASASTSAIASPWFPARDSASARYSR